MTELPTGTVTFLFTDIEGSPRRRGRVVGASRTVRRLALPGLVALTTLFSVLAGAGAREATRRIRIAPGSSSAFVKRAVARGDRDVYLLRARAGETMTVRLTAVERNAALVILPPGQRKPLRGTEEGADATRWTGKLPKSGDYRLRIGSTRGNATYVLRVTVRRSDARGKG